MRKVVALVVVVLVLVAAGAAWSAEAPAPAANVIHATGHAVVKVTADTARVACSVRTQGKDAAEAEREATNSLQQLRNALTGLNLPEMTVRDTGVSVSARQGPNWPGMPPGGPDAGGPAPGGNPPTYDAVGAVIVTLHGDEAALHKNAALVVAAALGATGPYLVGASLSYLKEDDSKERQEAWEHAVQNAVANAQALARGLGVTLAGYGNLSMIPVAPQNPWEAIAASTTEMSRSMMERMFSGETPTPDVTPLQVEVTVYVDAMYK